MKYTLLLFATSLLLSMQSYAQTGVAINKTGNEPDTCSMLDVSSTEKGILIPRMTEGQRTAIALPAKGLLVYQNDGTEGFYYYNGSEWTNLSLVNFSESNFLYGSKYGVKLLAQNDAQTDVDFVLSPKGNGGILAQQPDGTATGGNIRGQKAVDLQMQRTAASQVASGQYATAIGYANTASQQSSTAIGSQNTASNAGSTAIGWLNTASGLISTAMGYYSFATGEHSTAIGWSNTASGKKSFASGYNNAAQSFGEMVLGIYATIGAGDPSALISTDRLFVIGNGNPISSRSDAFTILKNANTTIGGSLTLNGNGTDASITFPTVRGTSGQFLKTNADGTTQWANAVDPGTAVGQMQYWNGSIWTTIPAGQTGQILTFVNGVPTWMNDYSVNNLEIGDYYQGGIIAFFLESGDPGYDAKVRHGMIVAPTDQNQTFWSDYVTSTGATGIAIGTGNANTTAIVNTHGTSNAAGECYDLVLGGYSDWYLPSINELSRICFNRAAIGGFETDYYWTSSEHVSDYSLVYVRDLGGCNPELVSKTESLRVRAVRSF